MIEEKKKTEPVRIMDATKPVPPIPETGHRAEIQITDTKTGYDPGVDVMEVVKATFADLLEPKRVKETVETLQAVVASGGEIIGIVAALIDKGMRIASEVDNQLKGRQGRAVLPDDEIISVRRITGKLQK